MISIQLRHHFLFSPLFPFFSLFSLHEVWRRRFFHRKKKSDSRLHRQKATTARMGLWDELSNRQVGLFVSDYSKRDVSATGKFKSFWKDLQHLCVVCLVGKERTFFFLDFSAVLLMSRFFSQIIFFILCKAIEAVCLFDVEEGVLLCRSAACALLGLEGALQPLQRGVLINVASCSDNTDRRLFADGTAAVWWEKKTPKKLSRNVKMG